MTEEPKPQKAVDTASAIDKIIEQKKQIAGLDFFTREERREVLVELAELYMEDRGDAPDFVEVGEAGIAMDDAMRRQRRVQLVG